MWKQLQLYEQSKSIFWVEIGAFEKTADIRKIPDKKIFCHVPDATKF